MTKRVLDVGNCTPDHTAIRALLEDNFTVEVVQSHNHQEALQQLREGRFDLVLINRVFDRDGSSGLELLEQIKADEQLASVPAMLLTNYAQHQQSALALGAEPGFGKAELNLPQTVEKLGAILG